MNGEYDWPARARTTTTEQTSTSNLRKARNGDHNKNDNTEKGSIMNTEVAVEVLQPSIEAPAEPSRFEQRSSRLAFLPQALINAALVIASFNVYLFWAKADVRRYLWSTTFLDGVPFCYVGKGRELAVGFLRSAGLCLATLGFPIAVLICELNAWLQRTGVADFQLTGNALMDFLILLVLPVALSSIALLMDLTPATDMPRPVVVICAVVAFAGWTYALTVSRHFAVGYLLRNTYWQGVRGDIPSSAWAYGRRLLWPELSRWLTLGWTGPWRYVLRWSQLLNGAHFGAGTIRFHGRASALYPRFAVVWISITAIAVAMPSLIERLESWAAQDMLAYALAAAFVVIVILVAHYNQLVYRHLAESLTVGELRFRFVGTRRSVVKLFLTNLVMNVFSTGLAYYYTRLRIARYIVANIVIEGDASSLTTTDDAQNNRERFGEGLEALVASSYV